MYKLVLAIVLLCSCEIITGTKNEDNKILIAQVTESSKWTNEDLEKAKEIIEYFQRQERDDDEDDDDDDDRPLLGASKPEHNKHVNNKERDEAIDSWSIVWYVASFGGLIVFFLVVSCSEWCCRRNNPNQTAIPPLPNQIGISSTTIIESPPPAYELFAPPSYESCNENNEKNLFDIYVVPVHAIRPIIGEQPPEYTTAINIQENNHQLSTHSHA